ncbi:MAG: peptidoglycan-binding protein, partial [Clostridiales bacterium]|nr:peptidoglycan-binding protein [Candidatus Cacconaster stercorequi]
GLVEDGAFGEKTEAAVRAYQRDRGLEADGIVGSKTWTQLLK